MARRPHWTWPKLSRNSLATSWIERVTPRWTAAYLVAQQANAPTRHQGKPMIEQVG